MNILRPPIRHGQAEGQTTNCSRAGQTDLRHDLHLSINRRPFLCRHRLPQCRHLYAIVQVRFCESLPIRIVTEYFAQ